MDQKMIYRRVRFARQDPVLGRKLPPGPRWSAVRNLQWVLALLVLIWGCATPSGSGQDRVNLNYQEKIKEWQKRIQREGWSENQVNRILVQSRDLVTYRMEIQDHWDTPREFMARRFTGDCEDIVVFMMGNLRRLGYPHRLRVLVVRGIFEDHALLKVEMPEGGWKVYDVATERVRTGEMGGVKPLVEFDEKTVLWYPGGRNAENGRRWKAGLSEKNN